MNRHTNYLTLCFVVLGVVFTFGVVSAQEDGGQFIDPDEVTFDPDGLPELAQGFEASILLREPDIFHISALAFGSKGRLYIGGGPQYRHPDPDTAKDSIWVISDKNQDGKADAVKEFATGFNSIQGLAWHDGELWIANAPDLTYVRDTDGDLEADKYVKVFTNLGHLRHALHGLVWGPDGRLYMSQGNSKVQKGAPEAFRKLHSVSTNDPVEQPLNKVYSPEEYEADYIGKWPSREGGFLRMEPDGENLEIFARGMRNPWDWTFGPGFDWLAVDQDPGNYGDRAIMPFEDAYFGMNHPVAGFDWMGEDPRVAPGSHHFTRYKASSFVGTVYYLHDHFPEKYRNVFYIADWANNNIYPFRQKWDGALMKAADGMNENFADGGKNHEGNLNYTPAAGKPLFRPTDLAVGPGGALYAGGWGLKYGSNDVTNPRYKNMKKHWGRVFRIRHSERPLTPRDEWYTPKREKPYSEWTFDQLIADLGKQLPVWRTDAQLELVRRGKNARKPLMRALKRGELSQMAETYAIWALGRIGPDVDLFSRLAAGNGNVSRNVRIQAMRILEDQGVSGAADVVAGQLSDPDPRVRMAAALNVDDIGRASHLKPLAAAMEQETDPTVFYAQWKALEALGSRTDLITLLKQSQSVNVQGGVLFVLEDVPDAICSHLSLAGDGFSKVRDIVVKKCKENCQVSFKPGNKRFSGTLKVNVSGPVSQGNGLTIRYEKNGKLTAGSPVYKGKITIDRDTRLRAALFSNGERIGPVVEALYDAVSDDSFETLVVTNLQVSNGKNYQIQEDALSTGEKLYIDRDYTYKDVPEKVKGATYIQTANEDAGYGDRDHLQFAVNTPSTVYIAIDERADGPPGWMKDAGFEKTGMALDTTDVSFHLYAKTFDEGNVVLGGNDGAGGSNYQVMISSTDP